MDPYELLGVDRDADIETIKSVYRQLARTFHPDVNSSAEAVEHFRSITEAYLTLSDPRRRAERDRARPRKRRVVGHESDSEVDVRVAGLSLGGLLGISVHTRVRPLFADDLDEDERPLPRGWPSEHPR